MPEITTRDGGIIYRPYETLIERFTQALKNEPWLLGEDSPLDHALAEVAADIHIQDMLSCWLGFSVPDNTLYLVVEDTRSQRALIPVTTAHFTQEQVGRLRTLHTVLNR